MMPPCRYPGWAFVGLRKQGGAGDALRLGDVALEVEFQADRVGRAAAEAVILGAVVLGIGEGTHGSFAKEVWSAGVLLGFKDSSKGSLQLTIVEFDCCRIWMEVWVYCKLTKSDERRDRRI